MLGPEVDAEALFDGWREELHRRRLALFKEMVGRAGAVEHRVLGLDHLKAALADGRGAILWAAPFAHQSLNGKRALFEAGIAAHQVSEQSHGFLGSRFARTVLNPSLLLTEDRFLAKRLSFSQLAPQDIALRMRAALRAGGVLIVENNAESGRRFLRVPLSGAWTVDMATGPIRLALRQGAPLLPCATIAHGAFGPYEMTIGSDIAFGEPREVGDEAVLHVALRARNHMLAELRRKPMQFTAWSRLLPAGHVATTRRALKLPIAASCDAAKRIGETHG